MKANKTYMPKAGDKVLCTYRLPAPVQHWIHPAWVGMVQEPGDDPLAWNGANSERSYCEITDATPVRYPDGERNMHDSTDSLFPVPAGKDATWAVASMAEAADLQHRALALAGRHADDRLALMTKTLGWYKPENRSSALYEFAESFQVRDEAHRARLLVEIADLMPPMYEDPGESRELERLAGMVRHLPLGVEVCRR